jgi:hypothetical protein
MERLAQSLDNHDLHGLSVLAGRIEHTARQHRIVDVADVAAQLEQAAKTDTDLQTIAELTNDLLTLCRATQSAFTCNSTGVRRDTRDGRRAASVLTTA